MDINGKYVFRTNVGSWIDVEIVTINHFECELTIMGAGKLKEPIAGIRCWISENLRTGELYRKTELSPRNKISKFELK